MQSLAWYANRLRAMSAPEVWWRLTHKARDLRERVIQPGWQRGLDLKAVTNGAAPATPVVSASSAQLTEDSQDILIATADEICENRLTIFNLEQHDLGSEVQWNFDYEAERSTPMMFAPRIDYRDHAVTGDAKLVWEPNRHQHLVVLGRAYRLTGERRYAEKLAELLETWIEQCPCGRGMNWRSPLELAIRMINWVWALDLVSDSGAISDSLRQRIIGSAYQHMREVTRKYSRFSSANNHLVGEAAGVFIGSTYFTILKDAHEWERTSRRILIEQIRLQTLSDGGHAELAIGYHLFVLEFFLYAGLRARQVGRDFPNEYWQRLHGMFDFLAALLDGGEEIPMFNDADDGYVLDLGAGSSRYRDMMAVGAVLFSSPTLKSVSGGPCESLLWLFGPTGFERFEELDCPGDTTLRSQALAGSGYYLLQSGQRGGADAISIAVDCAELGMGSIAAHGHADALSFTLRVAGVDVFVDPGTYDYFTEPGWRQYFRSTRAHNTVEIDGLDQSEMKGLFLWGRRAKTRCTDWAPSANGGTIVGEHDGYMRLAGAVMHQRRIALEGREITIEDNLDGRGLHDAAVCFNLSELCRIERSGHNRFEIDFGSGVVVLELDPGLHCEILIGSAHPIAGWVSRGYHRKVPAPTIIARCSWRDTTCLKSRISVSRGDSCRSGNRA